MTNLSRRALLLGTSALAAAAVAGCGVVSSTTTNGVTTVTLNVATVVAWGTAFANFGSLMAGLAGIVGTPGASLLSSLGAMAAKDLAAFQAATNGQVTLTFNSTSVPAAISSLLGDAKALANDASNALPTVAPAANATAQTYISALNTLISGFNAALGVVTTGAAPSAMTQAAALKVLGVGSS